jgi:hypothetical protein
MSLVPELGGLTPGSYVKVEGRWFYVADASYRYSHVEPLGLRRPVKLEPTGPDEVELKLYPAPWKVD